MPQAAVLTAPRTLTLEDRLSLPPAPDLAAISSSLYAGLFYNGPNSEPFFPTRLMNRWFYLLMLGTLAAAPAFAACPLADGPAGTTVPDGYRYSQSGRWNVCADGKWKTGGDAAAPKAYSGDNTGVCLPLDHQFKNKNGMISMNFVEEKTRRKFFGMEHECVNGDWWRLTASTVQAPAPSAPAAEDSTPGKQLTGLQEMKEPEPAAAPMPDPAASPSGSSAARPIPGSDAPKTMDLSDDYKRCQTHCREGMDQRLREADYQCKKEQFDKLGDVQWPPQAVQAYNRCRLLAARRENLRLKTCLLPCKKQAGQYIWMGN